MHLVNLHRYFKIPVQLVVQLYLKRPIFYHVMQSLFFWQTSVNFEKTIHHVISLESYFFTLIFINFFPPLNNTFFKTKVYPSRFGSYFGKIIKLNRHFEYGPNTSACDMEQTPKLCAQR